MPETVNQTQEVPILDVRAAPVPSTFNEEELTCVFVASTGARGLRRRYWDEDYFEELEISETAVRLGRLNNGAPFLRTHLSQDIDDVIGVVRRAWIESGQVMIEVQFSRRDSVAPVIQDVRDGVLPHVSLAYNVYKYDVVEKQGDLDVKRATDWEPMEVTLVPIAFDDAATVRSADAGSSQAVLNRSAGATHEEVDMTTEVQQDQAPAATETPENETRGVEALGPDPREVAADAVRSERERVTEIRRAVRNARLGDELADDLIAEGVTVDAARARILDEWAAQDTSEDTSQVRTGTDAEVQTRIREHAAEGLLFRGGVIGRSDLSEGNGFANMTLLRLSEELLSAQGVNVRSLSQHEIATRALSTSDLAHITGSVMNRTLLNGYESAPRTFVNVFRQATAQDFRNIERIRLSGAPALEEVKEGGEFKYGKVTDEKETYSLATYGKILPFTRQTIINDDLDALVRVPQLFGRAAADLESDIVWGIVTDNAALQDGTALFHADHGNLGTAGAPSETTLDEMEQLMLAQTGMEGRLINVMAKYLIVGPKQKLAAKKILTSVTPDQSSNVNVFQNAMDLVVEARLTGDAWYSAADYMQVDTIEYAYLAGNQGVYLETREGFNRDGIEVKARHDFAAKAIDYRGLFKNAGS